MLAFYLLTARFVGRVVYTLEQFGTLLARSEYLIIAYMFA